MLQIAADLRKRGNVVRLITAHQHRTAVESAGVTFVDLPPEGQPRPTAARRGLLGSLPLIDQWRSGRTDMRSVFIDPLEAQHRTLQNEIQRDNPDAVVVDVAYTGALPLLLGGPNRPPVAVCGVGPLMLSSVDVPPFGVGWQPEPGADYRRMNRFVHHILFADIQARFNAALRRAGVGSSPVFLTDWPKLADRLLQLSVATTEYPRSDLLSSVVFTGPVLPGPAPDADDLPSWWPDVQGTSRTVVHVTQGTWDNRDLGELVLPTLAALAHRDDLMVVATTGAPEQPVLSAAVPDNAYLTHFLPYASLLPYVDVMITNGGYGGVQHALSHGIPLIVAGRAADKPEAAARVDFTGAGIDLKTARPTTAAITNAVDRILSDDSYRQAAQRISREMAATKPLDTIADELAGLQSADAQRRLATGLGAEQQGSQ